MNGAFNGQGTLIDTLVVKIDVDLSGFKRGMAEAIAQIQTLRGAIAGQIGGASLGDALTAAVVTPLVVATARIGQMRNEMRMLTQEMRSVALLAAPGVTPAGGRSLGALILPTPGGAVIDAQRTPRPMRGSGGRYVRGYDATEGDDLRDAARGGGMFFVPPAASSAANTNARYGASSSRDVRPDAAARYRRRYGVNPPDFSRPPGPFDGVGRAFGSMWARGSRQTGEAFSAGRAAFPGYGEAVDNLGGSAHSVGQGARRVAGSRIAQALGLVGLGALFGDLLKLAASLATTIGATLAGAFAALMTPLGAVVAAVAALAALFVAANWDQFKQFGEWFASRWKDIIGGEGMGDVVSGWNNLKAAFEEFWATVKLVFRDDGDSILAILQLFGEVVIRVVNAALEVIGGVLNTLAELVRAVAALIRGDWAGAWEHFGHAVQAAFRTVTNTIGSLFPEVQKVVDEIASWIEARFEDMGNAVAGFWDFLTGGGGGRGKAANDNKSASAPKASAGGGYRRAGGFGRASAQDNDLARMSYLADSFGYAIADAFGAAVTGAARFSDVLRGLILQLADMVMQIAVLEPLAQSLGGALQGVFTGGSGKSNAQIVAGKMSGGGNSGGGFWGAVGSVIGGMFGGMFADGGYLAPGKWGIVGERGPEVVFGGRSGMSVFANDNGASGGFAYNDNRSFDMRGASVEAVQRLERALADDRADFGRRWMEVSMQARRRGAA